MTLHQLSIDPAPVKEEWRSVVGWEGYYEVSDHGRVRSVDRTVASKAGWSRQQKGRILTPNRTIHGYPGVNLSHQAVAKYLVIHRLVLEAFIGPRPEGYECCHKDGNPQNNSIANLRWDTRSSNRHDQIEHGTLPRGERNGGSHLRQDDVMIIRNSTGREIDLAARFGCDPRTIRGIRARRHGYWAWLEDQA